MKIAISAWKFHPYSLQQSFYVIEALNVKNLIDIIIINYNIDKKNESNKLLNFDWDKFKYPDKKFLLYKKILHKILYKYKSKNYLRYIQEKMFDDFVYSNLLNSKANLLYYDISSGKKSIELSKKMGIITVVHEQMAHPEYIHSIGIEESSKFNIKYEYNFPNVNLLKRKKIVLENCDYILALSKSVTKKTLVNYGIPEEKIKVVPLGVDIYDNYNFEKKDEIFRVLFVGNGTLIKGVPYLLEAWQKLNLKNSELIIIGSQNHEILKRYRKFENIVILGVTDPRKYYKEASIFVQPSIFDAFSRAVLEAMSYGLPVIISDGVGAQDIISNGKEGFIVPSRNVDELAQRIEYFYKNRDIIITMGKKARDLVKKYSWKRYGNSISSILEKILK